MDKFIEIMATQEFSVTFEYNGMDYTDILTLEELNKRLREAQLMSDIMIVKHIAMYTD